jgi:hypothetical protein
MIALSETNTEWHKHELRNDMDKVLTKAFWAAITEYGTSSYKFETSNYKPGGTICSTLGIWAHRICASGRKKLATADGQPLPTMLKRGIKLQSYLRTGLVIPPVGAKQRRAKRRPFSMQTKS